MDEELNKNNTAPESNKRPRSFYVKLIIAYAIVILLILLFVNYDSFSNTVSKFLSILSPIIYGLIIAYLCNPIFKFFFAKVFKKMKSVYWRKALSLVVTYIIVLILIFGIVAIVIEQLISNIQTFLENVGTYASNTETAVVDFINGLDFIKSEAEIKAGTNAVGNESAANILGVSFTKESVITFIKTALNDSLKEIYKLGNKVLEYGTLAASVVINFFVGLIFSVYVLAEKEMLCAKARKLATAMFKTETSAGLITFSHYTDQKIGHFIRGKILESIIVGIIAYVSFVIFKIPTPLVIAMIVAVMNIIPIFGPFLGAIPAALLVFLIDPGKTIPYIIIVIILMQVNGNYISPRIVGTSTGLTALGAITALILMSGLFSIIGMFIGVPIVAILIELLWTRMNKRLKEKNLSTDLNDYYSPEFADIVNDEKEKKHRRNITAFTVDSVILLFKKIFKKDKSNKKDSDKK